MILKDMMGLGGERQTERHSECPRVVQYSTYHKDVWENGDDPGSCFLQSGLAECSVSRLSHLTLLCPWDTVCST